MQAIRGRDGPVTRVPVSCPLAPPALGEVGAQVLSDAEQWLSRVLVAVVMRAAARAVPLAIGGDLGVQQDVAELVGERPPAQR